MGPFNGCVDVIPIVLSPVAARAASSPVQRTVPLVQEFISAPTTGHERHLNRLEELRQRLQDHIRSTADTQVASPSPSVVRAVEFTQTGGDDGTINGNSIKGNDDDASDLRDLLLLNRACRPQTESFSLRLSADVDNNSCRYQQQSDWSSSCRNDKNFQQQGGVDGSNRVEHNQSVCNFLGRQVDFSDDEKRVSDVGGERRIFFHLKCLKCSTNEYILIDPSAPCVAFCPFCGFPQR